jgi:tRNA nucleotidyltransferase/poly(A) polymerase/predicted kinase
MRSIKLNNILENKKPFNLKIPSDILKIHQAFKKSGKKLYVVGGAVRDAIMGISPKDFDLATDAKPDEVITIANRYNFPTVEVGKSFGVVIIGGHEIASFRKDVGKGRRPDSVDYTDIAGDVMRRDLTVNALFYDIDRKEIVDLVGGFKDIKNNYIRTVGAATDRFDEDPLRKLRILRFTFRMGGVMDKAALDALKQDPTLKGVSAERIRDEFIKTIKSAKNVKDYLETMLNIKMMQYVLPNQTINKSDFINSNKPEIVLAYIFRNKNSNEVSKYLNGLRYTTGEVKDISFLIDMYNFNPNDIVGLKTKEKLTSLSKQDIIEWGKRIGKSFTKFTNFKLSVSGNDVIKMGYSGKDVGKIIKDLETKNYLKESVGGPTITFLVGPPASGKSTWVSKNRKNAIIISRDDLVDKMRTPYGWSYSQSFQYPEFQEKVNTELKRHIASSLKSGKDIIVDMTNMTKKSRSNILKKVPNNYTKNAVVFNVSRSALITRLEKRKKETGKDIPLDVVDRMIKMFQMPTADEFDNIKIY